MSYLTTLPLSLPFLPSPVDPALEPSVRRALRRGAIALGTETEPWPASKERRDEGTVRAVLESLIPYEGLEISVVTGSPRVLRDLDLLAELDRRHAVRIDVRIPAVNPALALRIETESASVARGERSAGVAARFHTVEALAAEGIETRVLCSPVIPGLNDGEETLRELFEVARGAGASDVAVDLARMPHPSPSGLRRLLAGPEQGPEPRLATLVRRLRLEHGFPRALPGRG